MKPMLYIRRVWCVSNRFKSKISKQDERIKRLNFENKLMYGKLLESTKAKTKRLASENYFKNLNEAHSYSPDKPKAKVGRRREQVKLQNDISSSESDKSKRLMKDKGMCKDIELKKNGQNHLDNDIIAELEMNVIKNVDKKSAKQINNRTKESKKENAKLNKSINSHRETFKQYQNNVTELNTSSVNCDKKYVGEKNKSEEDFAGDGISDELKLNVNYAVHYETNYQKLNSTGVEPNEKIVEENSEHSQSIEKTSVIQLNNDMNLSSPCSSSSVPETSESDNEEQEYFSSDNDISESYLTFPLFNELKKNKYSPMETYSLNTIKETSNYDYPTVSVILRESMSETSEWNLNRWKEKLIAEKGAEEFESFQKLQLLSGSTFRQQIIKRLKGTPELKLVIEPCMIPYWNSLKQVFPLFTNVKMVGAAAVHSQLKYKGAVDCLVEFQDTLMLVNWKKSRRVVPSLESAFDMPIQIAAYIGAINFDHNYPFMIEDALLVVCYSDGTKADILHMNSEKCLHYWNLWLKRLYKYQMRQKEPDIPRIRAPPKKNIEQDWKIIKETLDEQQKIKETCTNDTGKDTSLKEAGNSLNNDKGDQSSSSNILPIVASEYVTSNATSKKMMHVEQELVSKSILQFPLYNAAKNDYVASQQIEKYSVNELFVSCPAVTSILNESRSESAKFLLERWKRNLIAKLGEEGFERYQTKLLQDGSDFHKLVQDRLNGVPERMLNIKSELFGCWCSLKPVFPLISRVKLTESKVVHEKLKYKGIVDCVAEFQNKLVVIDWKKSDKIKSTINMTYDAPVQVAAYIGAINFDSCYSFKIKEGLLVVSYTDGSKADIFHINEENSLKYWKLWLERLHKYEVILKKNSLKIDY